jgi:hypothetical protein
MGLVSPDALHVLMTGLIVVRSRRTRLKIRLSLQCQSFPESDGGYDDDCESM